MQNDGIRVLYSGDLGEIRHSKFRKLRKGFDQNYGLSFKYVLTGQENYYFAKEQYTIDAGQALFLNDRKSFECKIEFPEPTSGICINLNFDQIKKSTIDPLMEREMFLFDPEFSTQRLTRLDQKMTTVLNKLVIPKPKENPLYFQEVLSNLMLQILKMEESFIDKISTVPSKKKSYQKELFKRLLVAKHFIYDNRKKGVSLKEIAKQAHVSEFYLHRVFSKVFGFTPSTYLEHVRMEEANSLLQKGLSIREVSYSVGYNDESYFCRRFKKAFGKTPKQYQRNISN